MSWNAACAFAGERVRPGAEYGYREGVRDDENKPPPKKWYSIHLVVPAEGYFDFASGGVVGAAETSRFMMMVAESVVSTNTGCVNRMPHSSPYKVKSLFLQECLRRVVVHTALRMAQLGEANTSLHRRNLATMNAAAAKADKLRSLREAASQSVSVDDLARVLSKASDELYGLDERSRGVGGDDRGALGLLRTWVVVPGRNEGGVGVARPKAYVGHLSGSVVSLSPLEAADGGVGSMHWAPTSLLASPSRRILRGAAAVVAVVLVVARER